MSQELFVRETLDAAVPLRLDRVPAWDGVLERVGARTQGRPQRARRRLVVAFAVIVLVATVAAAAVGAVRVVFLDKGFIGLPPVGATPSTPEEGELRLSYFGPGPKGSDTKVRSWLYADGRLISAQDGPAPGGANPLFTGFLERRLMREGVELLRSEALSTGHWGNEDVPPPSGPPCPNGVSPGTVVRPATVGCVPPTTAPAPDEPTQVPFYLFVEAPHVGRLLRVDHARELDRLVERLTDPDSWLPASAWADRAAKAYVASKYAVCYGGWPPDSRLGQSEVVGLFPIATRDLLRDASAREGPLFGAPGNFRPTQEHCFDATTDEAREVVGALEAAGLERKGSRRLNYDITAGGNDPKASIHFEPYLPHGEITCSVCG